MKKIFMFAGLLGCGIYGLVGCGDDPAPAGTQTPSDDDDDDDGSAGKTNDGTAGKTNDGAAGNTNDGTDWDPTDFEQKILAYANYYDEDDYKYVVSFAEFDTCTPYSEDSNYNYTSSFINRDVSVTAGTYAINNYASQFCAGRTLDTEIPYVDFSMFKNRGTTAFYVSVGGSITYTTVSETHLEGSYDVTLIDEDDCEAYDADKNSVTTYHMQNTFNTAQVCQ